MKRPGLRNIKTALSVVISALIVTIFNNITGAQVTYFYAAITAVFTLQQTHGESLLKARDRFFGTVIGAAVAILIGIIRFNIIQINLDLVYLFFGIMLCIFLVDAFNLKAGVMIACIMLIASLQDQEQYYIAYTFLRGIETLLGATVAILVNRYVFPYNKEVKMEN